MANVWSWFRARRGWWLGAAVALVALPVLIVWVGAGFRTQSWPVLGSSSPRITIFIQAPENLTGNQALSRGLESFDRVIASKLRKKYSALVDLLETIPKADTANFSQIRLNGRDGQLAKGAPIEHPLFEWISSDRGARPEREKPTVDVVLTSQGAADAPNDAYKVRFVSKPPDNSGDSQPRRGDRPLGKVIIEVHRERMHEQDACRIEKELTDIFPGDEQVALEPIFDSVAACILSDHVKNLPSEEKAAMPEQFAHLFPDHGAADNTRITNAIQGIEQYEVFARSWNSRPDEASKALDKALEHFDLALKPTSEQRDTRAADPASYPIIGYLHAHALTSSIVGYPGRPDMTKDDKDKRKQLGGIVKAAFATSPFSQAHFAKALAYDALGNFEESATAWFELVAALTAQPIKPDELQAGASRARKLVAARTRLMLSYRALNKEKEASETREAIVKDIERIDHLISEAKRKEESSGLQLVEIDRVLMGASFELDMAVDHANIFLTSIGALDDVQAAPSISTLMGSDRIVTLITKSKRDDGDFCAAGTPGDKDLEKFDPANFDTAAASCKEKHADCETFRKTSQSYLRFIGKRFLGAALRKLAWAHDTLARERIRLCGQAPDLEACRADGQRAGEQKNTEPKADPLAPRKADLVVRLRQLTDLEATVGIVREIFTCYAPDFIAKECATGLPLGASTAPTPSATGTASSSSTDSTASAPMSQEEGPSARWKRWLELPSMRESALQAQVLCAIRKTVIEDSRGKAIADEMRYGTLSEVWAESPPSPSSVDEARRSITAMIGTDAYRSESLSVLRALFAYASVWSTAPKTAEWLGKSPPDFDRSGACSRGSCDEPALRQELAGIGKSVLVDGTGTDGRDFAFLSALGEALEKALEETALSSEQKAEVEELVACRAGSGGDPPPSCLVGKAMATHATWLRGLSMDPQKAQELRVQSYTVARHLRHEVMVRVQAAFARVVLDFFSKVESASQRAGDDALEMQVIRIAFFRVLLLEGAPTPIDDDVKYLALVQFQRMLEHEGDMGVLVYHANRNHVNQALRRYGFTHRPNGSRAEAIETVSQAEEAIAGLTSDRDGAFGACGSLNSLRQFFGYADTHAGAYDVRRLKDPHADMSLELGPTIARWCQLRGLSSLSEATVLRTLVGRDLEAARARDTKIKPDDGLSALARFVGSDAFLTYAYARHLLRANENQAAEEATRGMEQLDAKIARARALLRNNLVGPAFVVAVSARRQYELLAKGRSVTLDGAIYVTEADAAFRAGTIGGVPTAHDDQKEDWEPAAGFRGARERARSRDTVSGPRPEYLLAVRAYKQAIDRGRMEGVEGLTYGIRLRRAAALIETYDDDGAVQAVSAEDGFFCQKGKLLAALARWGRGEHDVGRQITARGLGLTLFDLDKQSDPRYCPADAPRIPLGWRAKQLRSGLLQERSRMAEKPE